jgi:hypothetical protein
MAVQIYADAGYLQPVHAAAWRPATSDPLQAGVSAAPPQPTGTEAGEPGLLLQEAVLLVNGSRRRCGVSATNPLLRAGDA